ncbi:MAG: TonB family protein [Fibrobacterales bacterium]
MITHWPTILSATTVGIAHCLFLALPQGSASSAIISDVPTTLTVEISLVTVAESTPVAFLQPKQAIRQPELLLPSKVTKPEKLEPEKTAQPEAEFEPDVASDEIECANPQEPTQAIPDIEVTELSQPTQPVKKKTQWQKPLFKNPPTPAHYPRRARKRKQEGTVLMHVHIDNRGEVIQSKIATSSGYALLDEAAHKAVFEWEFIPGTKTDNQVGVWIEVPVHFILHPNNKG